MGIFFFIYAVQAIEVFAVSHAPMKLLHYSLPLNRKSDIGILPRLVNRHYRGLALDFIFVGYLARIFRVRFLSARQTWSTHFSHFVLPLRTRILVFCALYHH